MQPPLFTVLVIAGVAAFVISSVGIGRYRHWAVRRRILDVANARSSHSGVVPRGAGVVIVAVALGGLTVVWWLMGEPWPAKRLVAYLAGGVIVAGVSWLDDLRSLSPAVRVIAHFAAAIVVVVSERPEGVVSVPLLGEIAVGWFAGPLAVAWIVWLTNAFNFMDGADALAGLQAVVASAGWLLLGVVVQDSFLTAAAMLILGASVGFLRHNWPPAGVFMGDVGSAFLGYTFAAYAVIGATTRPSLGVAGVLVLWPFCFDAAFTLLRRLWRAERVWEPHRSHLYQRSIARGAAHADVAIQYALAAVISVVTAVAWVTRFDQRGILVLCVAAGSALWLWVTMTARERELQVSPHA